jgi:hypothetical protein
MTLAGLRAVLQRQHVLASVNRLVVDRQQDVAGPDTGAAGGRRRRDLRGHHAQRPLDPEHPVFNFDGGRPRDDIGEAKRQQRKGHRNGQGCLPPFAPPGDRGGNGHVRRWLSVT